ncbi:hypothetical protein Slin15195_G028560 [Septoria linicola]|uniref:Uncharacterized protein n=1 Tax=Septoria linicola TaxID=215465 RepID=A0A9Q9AHW2_9PEZI|nr:hypothetical protein Slin14017_G027600 [Septoria linicola]USW49537.1 hypothetical protein Slin15195_G028560 [Septoria linicola]
MKVTYDDCVNFSSKTFGSEEGHGAKTHQAKNRRLSKKNGPHAKRVEMITKKLSGQGEESVFVTMGKKGKADLVKRLSAWKVGVKEATDACSNDILRDLDVRFQEAGEEEEEIEQDPHVVETIRKAAHDALNTVNGELAGYIEECEAFERGT